MYTRGITLFATASAALNAVLTYKLQQPTTVTLFQHVTGHNKGPSINPYRTYHVQGKDVTISHNMRFKHDEKNNLSILHSYNVGMTKK